MDSRYKPSDAMKTALEGLASEVLEMKTNFEVSYTQLVDHILARVYCRCQKACRPAFMFSRNVFLSITFICAWYVHSTNCFRPSLCLMMVSFQAEMLYVRLKNNLNNCCTRGSHPAGRGSEDNGQHDVTSQVKSPYRAGPQKVQFAS